MKRRILSVLLILCITLSAILPVSAEDIMETEATVGFASRPNSKPDLDPFKDTTMHWGKYAILWAAKNGYVNGTERESFSPDDSMTRAMFATVLYRYEGKPSSGNAMGFNDIPSGAYYYEAVRWAAQSGIVNGTSTTTFNPDDSILRQDIAVMLYRYQKYKSRDTAAGSGLDFPDSNAVDEYAREAMAWAVGQGIISGKNGRLDPKGLATRAEVVTMMQREDNGPGPVLFELIPLANPTADATPSYAFYSSHAGSITYAGGISSPTTKAMPGENYITFHALSNGSYSGMSIKVTDSNGQSKTLQLGDFTVQAVSEHDTLFSHIKTAGFDYDDVALIDPDESAWVAQKHDMVVTGNVKNETVYDNLRRVNEKVQLIGYISMYTTVADWMDNWCLERGIDPETLYYHYEIDTVLETLDGKRSTPGYGKGNAKTLKEARVRTYYSAGYPVLCPTSSTFQKAFTEYAWTLATVNASKGKYIDGLFMDGYVNNCWNGRDVKLENTIEMRKLGKTTNDSAKQQFAEDMVSMRNQMEQQISAAIGKDFTITGNASEVDWIFDDYKYLFTEKYDHVYNEATIEFLTDYIRCRVYDIDKLKSLYDGFESGGHYLVNSGTHYSDRTKGTADTSDDLTEEEWQNYLQFLMASQYLVNHKNGNFAFHIGSASYYGGQPKGTLKNTHWHQNYEYDIGRPVVRGGADYWGETNTDRFFVLDEAEYVPGLGTAYKVLAREYENALVIAKFGGDSYPKVGRDPLVHQLDGSYRRLMPDNTLGPVITEITLGQAGGAILIKAE